jgi:hypothetical protein
MKKDAMKNMRIVIGTFFTLFCFFYFSLARLGDFEQFLLIKIALLLALTGVLAMLGAILTENCFRRKVP